MHSNIQQEIRNDQDKLKISEPVLKLEEESIVEEAEPLILDKVHEEKQSKKKVKTKKLSEITSIANIITKKIYLSYK